MARISNEKLARLKARARGAGRAAARGAKGSAMTALMGTVAYYGSRAVSERSQTMREKWYILPAAMAVTGHFLRRKPKFAEAGGALLAIAGYQGAMNYEMDKATQKPAAETKGLIDPRRGDAGALSAPAPYDLPEQIWTDANAGTDAWGTPTGDEGDVTAAMGL